MRIGENMTVTLTKKDEELVRNLLRSGKFKSVGEIIDEGLRILREQTEANLDLRRNLKGRESKDQ